MECWSILLSIVICATGSYYLFRNYNFFKRHGIIHLPAVPILGNMTSVIFRQISFPDYILKIYNFNPDAKYFGFYVTTSPIFFLRDPEIIKSVIVKDFEAFPNRRGFSDLNEPLFAKNLFSLQGKKWRDVRSLLSPSFTTSKMKMMFTLMSECAVDFANFWSTSILVDNGDVDMKDAFAKYTNDVIATCAFGIKINSMKDPTNKFYVYGKEAINFFKTNRIRFLFLRTFPKLGRILNVKLIEKFHLERFVDNKMYHNFFCYMPFGLGPRMCIANRVALLEMKVLLFHLLARYELKLCTKTTLPIKFNKKNLIIMPENGFWLNVQHRSDVHPILESIIINDVVKS